MCSGELPAYAQQLLTASQDGHAAALAADATDSNRVAALVQRGLAHFFAGVDVFTAAQDASNQALLYSNCGQICRLHAHAFAQLRADQQFSEEERKLLLDVSGIAILSHTGTMGSLLGYSFRVFTFF